MSITTVNIAHEPAFGELRLFNLRLSLPIGDDLSKPYIIDALQDYIDAMIDNKVGDGAHETFVADNGVVIHSDHAFPLVDYLEALSQQKLQA